MKRALLWLVAFALLAGDGLLSWSVAASGASTLTTEASGLAGPLGTGLGNEEPAAQGSPSSGPVPLKIAEESRTAFSGLGRDAANELAKQTFGLAQPSVPLPGTTPGSSVRRYLATNAAVERQPGGQDVVVASSFPLRLQTETGLKPTSFKLEAEGETLVPENPVVPIAISTATGEVDFADGMSVDSQEATPEAPIVDGDRAFFANVRKDTDLVSEARPEGAEISWILRSQSSPREEALDFRLPTGAYLQHSSEMPGAVEVAAGGERLLLIPPATAMDASGRQLPVNYAISGRVLTASVEMDSDVEFPVKVDPYLWYGTYGRDSETGTWAGWTPTTNYADPPNSNGYRLGIYPSDLIYETGTGSVPSGAYGGFKLTAPGLSGMPGSAGIWQVALVGAAHNHEHESYFVGKMLNSTGKQPTWKIVANGHEGGGTLRVEGYMTGEAINFCAEQGCAEGYQAGSFEFLDELTSTSLSNENYASIEGALVAYRDAVVPNRVVLNHPGYEEGVWLKTAPTNFTIEAEDEGLGVAEVQLQTGSGEKIAENSFECTVTNGFTGCATKVTSPALNLAPIKATGAITLEPAAIDAAANVARPAASDVKMYLDQTKPALAVGVPAGGLNIGAGNDEFTLETQDGSPSSPQSGPRSIEVTVDGKTVDTINTKCGEPRGIPASNCFELSGKWIMNGLAAGAGPHAVDVIAKDWAGNVTEESFTVTVNEASYEPVGPGAVNLFTGDFRLNTTDVSLPAGAADLGVTRAFDSRKPTQGASGPLGPQWLLSLPDGPASGEWQSLSVLTTGVIALYDAHGNEVLFAPEGTGYRSPAGFQADTLSKLSATEYKLTNAYGDYTIFTQTEAGASFTPTTVAQASGAGGLNKVIEKYTKTAEGVVEPTEVLGPEPSEGACNKELVKGCRALTFVYATHTEAESGSEWGEYKGRLSKVQFTAWSNAEEKMAAPITVAQYVYDNEGRLRAEWDPRVSPALKTTYGYDSEGHVTAVSAPGQQPWLLHYGTTKADVTAGRLLSVGRFNAETTLWKGEKLKQTAAPALSTTSPTTGESLSVTSGAWNATAAYGFQWERCNPTGGECTAIGGATNETYTPIKADIGDTLKAQVTATDAWGSMTSTTSASRPVAVSHAVFVADLGKPGTKGGEFDEPTAIAVEQATGNIWVADALNHRIEQLSPSGAFLQALGWGVINGKEEFQDCTSECKAGISGSKPGQLENPEGIAVDKTGEVFVADSGDDLVQVFKTNGTYLTSFGGKGSGAEQLNDPHGIALDEEFESQPLLLIADSENNRILSLHASGKANAIIGKGPGEGKGEFKGPYGIAVAPGHHIYATDIENNRVQEFNGEGSWLSQFGSYGGTEGKFEYPWATTYDGLNGDIYVSSYGDGRIEAFTQAGAFVEQFSHWGSEPEELDGPSGVAVNNATGAIYIADEYNSRISEWAPNVPTTEPTQPTPSAGTTAITTVEYNIPLSGTGLQTLTLKETSKWGQKDTPTEGTAIFPPDEPQSWPASGYKRATIYYLDKVNRTVDTATPAGGIATNEYNATNNNLERTLSADNREQAVKEAKPQEAAEHLSTEYKYNSDGTELTSTLGPEHLVKIAETGAVVSARKHLQYTYDQESPGGATYRLPTETREGAQTAEGEKDVRTVKNRYSGQENLGWKLHAPTETETSTGTGQTLKTTTTYEPTTGEVTETAKAAITDTLNEYPLPAGSEPYGITATPEGLGFTDYGTKKVGRISTSGAPSEYTTESAKPEGIVSATGELWFVEHGGTNVRSINTAGTITTHSAVESGGHGIAKAGIYLWITLERPGKVVKLSTKGELKGLTELPEHSEPTAIIEGPDKNVWFTESGTNKLGTINTTGGTRSEYALPGESRDPDGLVAGPDGNLWIVEKHGNLLKYNTAGEKLGEYSLPEHAEATGITSGPDGNLWVAFSGTAKIATISTSGVILHEYGLPTGSQPQEITVGPDHNIWFTDYGTSKIGKISLGDVGNPAAHDTQTVYYTAAASSQHPECGNHAEWAGLPCESHLAAQPGTNGLPNVPVTTYTYNMWDEPVATTDTIGTTTRTTTDTYDNAGRLKTSGIAVTGSTDKALPSVTEEYNEKTGAVQKQTDTAEGEAESITAEENALGQITKYEDASGNKAVYEYEKEKDFRLLKLHDGEGSSAASTDVYKYSTVSGLLTSLKDEAPHGTSTFTAAYDGEGKMTSETYPNGVVAKYAYNQTGEPVSLEYVKGASPWYTESVTPSIHGQLLTQTSSLGKEVYAYDGVGRLTEAQETPTGEGCTARLYAYDEDGNRTSLTTRGGSESKCPTEGGAPEFYEYDTADRLFGGGVSYEPFGNIASLPREDAGGFVLNSTYYVDDQVASLEQDGQAISYTRDPVGRTRQATGTGTESFTITDHYAGSEETPAWVVSGTGKWSRNILGINGRLAAIEENGGTPMLQISSLAGNVVGTAQDTETETKITPTDRTSEYGVPHAPATAKYGWQGAVQEATELPTGIISTEARTYVPELGRFLQPDPRPGGSVNSYAYTSDDPIDETDPSGQEWVYHYENIQTGERPDGLAESYIGPGAVTPAEIEEQIELAIAADPPVSAATALWLNSGASGMNASASSFISALKSAYDWVKEKEHKIFKSGLKAIVAAGAFTAGTVIGAGTILATDACLDASEGLEATHCYEILLGGGSAAASSFVAGAAVLRSGLHEWF